MKHNQLMKLLSSEYGIVSKDHPVFVPVGLDSWNYRAGGYWVSVRRDFAGHVPSAYLASRRLKLEHGLEFVLAPILNRNGEAVSRLDDLAVVVHPARTLVRFPKSDYAMAISFVQRLHSVQLTRDVPRSPAAPWRHSLLPAIEAVLQRPRATLPSPYGSRLQELCSNHLTTVAHLYDAWSSLEKTLTFDADSGVVTHGEPSVQNFALSGEERLLLDWGALAVAPPERDWFHIGRTFGWHTLRDVGARTDYLNYYELAWWLGEIYEYVLWFGGDASGNQDDKAAWQRLSDALFTVNRLVHTDLKGNQPRPG
jgi:spectinomycin phosphotransferase